MRKTTITVGTFAALAAAQPAPAASPPGTPAPGAPGALDASFGATAAPRSPGVVVGPQGTSFRAVAVQPDGKVVAAGREGSASSPRLIVARFTSGGALDPSFSGDGIAEAPAALPGAEAGADTLATGVAVLPDGRIVAGGELRRSGSPAGFIAVRFTSGGALDTSFGGDGVASALTGDAGATASSLVVDGQGRALVGGAARPTGETERRATVVRFTAAGAPDGSFGSGGVSQFLGFGTSTEVGALALQPDGRIVAAGSLRNFYGAIAAMVFRLDAAGGLDRSLAGGAFLNQYARNAASSRFTSVAVEGDGSILAAGTAANLSSGDGMIVRLSPTGTPAAGFGAGGVVQLPAAAQDATVGTDPYPGFAGLVARPGTIYAAGPVEANGGFRLLALSARRAADGAALPGFGASPGPEYASSLPFAQPATTYTFIDGAGTQPFYGPQGQTTSLALTPDGTRLVAAGVAGSSLGRGAEPSDSRGFVARYVAAPEPAAQPGPDPQPQPTTTTTTTTTTPPPTTTGSSEPPVPVAHAAFTRATLSRRTIDRRHRATLRFTLSSATTVRLTIERATGSAPRVFRKVTGRRVIQGRAGVNTVTLSRTFAGRVLRRGSYRVVLRTPRSTSVRRVSFRVR